MPLGALAPLGRSQPATSPDSHTLDASASFDFEKILGGLDKPAGDDSPKKERKKSSKTSRDSTRDGARRTASSSRDKPKPKSHSLPPALDISSDFDFEKAKNTDLADLGDSFSNLLGDVTKMSGSTKSAFGGGGRQAASIAKKEKPAPAPASRSPPAAKPKSPAASPQRASPTQPLGRKGAAFGGDRGFSLSPTDASAAPSKAAAAPASKKKAESFFSDDDVDGLLPGSEDDYAKKPEAKTAGGFGRRPSMADDAAAARGAAGDARAASAGPAALFGGASFYGGAARPATGAAPDAAQGDAPTNVPSFLGAGGARPRRNLGSRRASTGASTCGAPAGDAFGLGAPAKQAADLFALNSSDDDDKPFAKAAFVAKDPFADLSAAKMASTPAPRPAAAIEPPPPPPGCMAAATPADKPAWMSATAPAGLQPASAALPAALATAQTAPPATTASLARGGRRGSAPAQYAAPAALYAAPQAAPYPGQAAAGQSAGQAAAGLLSDLSVHLSTPAAEPEAPQADARRSVPIWMTQKPGPEDDDAVQLGGSTVAPTPMAAPGPPRPAVTPCDALPQAAAAAPQQQPSPTQRTSGAADSSQQWQLPQPPQPQSAPRHDGAPKGAAPSGPPSEVRAAPAQSSGPPFADAAVLAEASALISSLKDTVAGLERRTADDEAARHQTLAELKEQQLSDRGDREAQHRSALDALRRVHEEELVALKRRADDTSKLANAEQKLQVAVNAFQNLETRIHDRSEGLDVAHEASMDARSRLITDMEASARLTREEADQEQAKLKGLLSAMDGVMRGMRGASAMEHERLHHEQSRLSTGQDALAAQAQAQREAAATAEAHLRARVRQGDTDRGRRDDVLDAKSAALIEAEAALNIRDVEWVRETAKSKSGLEQRAKSLDSKEAALRALQMKIEEEGRALDGKVQEVRSAMNRAAAREDAVESRERRVAEEQQRLLVMHAELQAASRAMSLRSSELDRATSESDRLALHGEAAAAELASHRAGLLEARAAAHELMHRTEHEKLRLLKDRTDVLKAKAALHRHATSTAVQLREPQAQHYAASNALTQAQAPLYAPPYSAARPYVSPQPARTVAARPPRAAAVPNGLWKQQVDRLAAAARRTYAVLDEQSAFLAGAGAREPAYSQDNPGLHSTRIQRL